MAAELAEVKTVMKDIQARGLGGRGSPKPKRLTKAEQAAAEAAALAAKRAFDREEKERDPMAYETRKRRERHEAMQEAIRYQRDDPNSPDNLEAKAAERERIKNMPGEVGRAQRLLHGIPEDEG